MVLKYINMKMEKLELKINLEIYVFMDRSEMK